MNVSYPRFFVGNARSLDKPATNFPHPSSICTRSSIVRPQPGFPPNAAISARQPKPEFKPFHFKLTPAKTGALKSPLRIRASRSNCPRRFCSPITNPVIFTYKIASLQTKRRPSRYQQASASSCRVDLNVPVEVTARIHRRENPASSAVGHRPRSSNCRRQGCQGHPACPSSRSARRKWPPRPNMSAFFPDGPCPDGPSQVRDHPVFLCCRLPNRRSPWPADRGRWAR